MARKNGSGPTERAIEAILTAQSAQATGIEAMRGDIAGLRTDVDGMRVDIAGLRTDVDGMRVDIAGLRTDVDGMRVDIAGLRTDVDGMRVDMRDMRDGLLDVRDDIRTLTRVMVRRFGTSGSLEPIVGDHVLFRSRDGVWRPAVVLAVHPSNELDLEVFGMRDGDDRRYPSAAIAGEEPGCWRIPG